jgi:hypothetical protein
MNDLLFEHYVSIAGIVVPGGLALLILGMLIYPAERRVIDCLSSMASWPWVEPGRGSLRILPL